MNEQARLASRMVIGIGVVALLSTSLLAQQPAQSPGAANPVPAASSTRPMAIAPPIGPPGMVLAGQAKAQIESLPISETSYLAPTADIEHVNQVSPDQRGTLFKALLHGKAPNVKFDGRTVSEQDAGGGTSNCIHTGLLLPQAEYLAHPAISNPGCWQVAGQACTINGNKAAGDYSGQSNFYGDDFISMHKYWLPGILSRNPGGCTVTLHQNMLIDCTAGRCKYWENTLVVTFRPGAEGDIYNGTVSATRKGGPSQ